VVGALGTLAAKARAAELSGPAIIIVGTVVTLRNTLDWRPATESRSPPENERSVAASGKVDANGTSLTSLKVNPQNLTVVQDKKTVLEGYTGTLELAGELRHRPGVALDLDEVRLRCWADGGRARVSTATSLTVGSL